MNTRLTLGISLLLGITTPALWSGSLRAADNAATPPRVLNVARASLGARLTVDLPSGPSSDGAPRISQALLSEDDPLGCELPAGVTSLVVALPKAETLHRLDFLNLTAAGRVTVAASSVRLPADSPRWRSLGGELDFAQPNDVVSCDLGTAEARYVRVTFNLPKAGRIDTLGLFGDATAASPGTAGARSVGGRTFVGYDQVDMGNVAAQARVSKVSSGGGPAEADRMLDGNLRTSYAFDVSDQHPTFVIDLGSNRTLTRASLAFHAGPGRMDFYLKPDPSAHTSIVRRNPSYSGQTAQVPEVTSDETPANDKPLASVQSEGGAGLRRVTVGLSGGTGRYLVVVFTPTGGVTPRATGDGKDFKDTVSDFKDSPVASSSGYGNEPLSISEVTAFGPPSTSITSIPQLPPPDRTGDFFRPPPEETATVAPMTP